MYLLDTNVLSEMRKKKPHGAVMAWLQVTPDYQLFVPAVAIGEIQKGIERTREQDMAKAEQIEIWLDNIVASSNIVDMNAEAFRLWVKFMHKMSATLSEDAMIASIAKVYGFTVVTRNVSDFIHFNVPILNPFET